MATIDEMINSARKNITTGGAIKNSDGSYSVNYNDKRFQDVKTEQALKESQTNEMYDNILNNSDKYYQNQIDATKEYEKTQSELQQAQTDFAIQQIEQQKDQSQKDYTREQKGAYVDYMKQTKSNAQNMANSGLNNTGYSESSIVSMYNTYQNRVGTAKESLNQSILNYNNSIQQAILANNEKLAEIAFNSLQTQNQLNQQAFEYKNTVILQKEQALQDLNNTYYARYQDVLSQINNEIQLQMELDRIDREYEMWLKEFTEKNRQWRAEFDERQRQFDAQQRQWEKENALQERKINSAIAAEQAQAAYYRAQAASIQNDKNPYSNKKDDTKKNSSGLGEYAQKMLTNIQKNKKSRDKLSSSNFAILGKPFESQWSNKTIKRNIDDAYNKKKITASEADILFSKLGL